MSFVLGDEAERVEVNGVEFTLRQNDYLDVLASYKQAREKLLAKGLISEGAELFSLEDRILMSRAAAFFMVLSRIVSWSGVVLQGGVIAECSEENKLKYFGQNPGAVEDLLGKLSQTEEEEIKNSETSQDG
jgi:hypothetical protein